MAEHEPERESPLEGDKPGPAAGSGLVKAGGGVTKAADASGFVRWEEADLPAGQNLAIVNKVIVKKTNVRPGAPQTIVPKIPTHVNRRSMEVVPLIEDETIVGMMVTCSCGNSHEVKFEFDV